MLNIHLTATDRYTILGSNSLAGEEYLHTFSGREVSLDGALEYARELCEEYGCDYVTIRSIGTGKLVAEVYTSEEEDEESDFDEADLECGFNPYEGCYDWDC